MSLKTVESDIWAFIKKDAAWVGKEWTELKTDGIHVAIAVTEDVNIALKSGVVDDIVKALSPNPDGLPQKILTAAKTYVPKILAEELGLQALSLTPTIEDTNAFVNQASEAFAGKNLIQKSEIYTNLATKLAILFKGAIEADENWAGWVITVEQAFQDIKDATASTSTDETAVD